MVVAGNRDMSTLPVRGEKLWTLYFFEKAPHGFQHHDNVDYLVKVVFVANNVSNFSLHLGAFGFNVHAHGVVPALDQGEKIKKLIGSTQNRVAMQSSGQVNPAFARIVVLLRLKVLHQRMVRLGRDLHVKVLLKVVTRVKDGNLNFVLVDENTPLPAETARDQCRGVSFTIWSVIILVSKSNSVLAKSCAKKS